MDKKAGPGSGAVAAVEKGELAVQGSNLPAKAAPVATMARFGGLRGGKKREDGHIPGSAEALEADRKKDAERKRAERAAAAGATGPAVLPSKVPLGAIAQGQLPTGDLSPVVGAVAPVNPFIPWSAQIVRPFTSELIPVVELVDIGRITDKAAQAGLSKDLLKAIEKDSQWPSVAKKTLDNALPELAAKWLNKTGISAEHAQEVAVASALLMIWTSRRSVTSRLDKLIEQRKEQERKEEKTRDAAAVTQPGTSYAGVAIPPNREKPKEI